MANRVLSAAELAASAPVQSVAGEVGAIESAALKSAISLNNVTNHAQTQAAVMPNTAPAAGRIPIGNAGGTAYAPLAVSGDATLASTGALTVTKTNGTSFGTMAVQNANGVTITGGTITGMPNPSASSDVATKGYIDGLITNPMSFQGVLDCSANPNYPSASAGHVYIVSTAGKIGGGSGANVDIGDMLVAKTTTLTGNQATVGANWAILEHNLQGALLAANNLSDVTNTATARANLGLAIGTDVLAPTGSGSGLSGVVHTVASLSDDISAGDLKTALSLSSVTDHAQTQAAIMPNTAPAAGRIPVGNAGGTAYAPVAVSGDATLAATGALIVTKTNGTSFGTMAVQNANSVAITGGTITGLSSPSSSSDAATKGYVDTAVTGLLEFQGATDCSANPGYPVANKGDTYVVSVAGKIGGASGKSVEVGDMYLASADNAGGTEASVGTSWSVLEHNLVGAMLAANNLSDVTNAATALANLGGQAASGNLTATITTSTPCNLSAGVLMSNGSDIDVVSPSTSNRVLAWNGTTIIWSAVQNAMISVSIDALKVGTGLVDNSEYSRLNGCTEYIQPRLDSLKIETQTLHFVAPTVQVWCVDAKAEYIYVINGLNGLKTSAGTATISVKINGTAVSGLNAISVTTTSQDVTASGVNVVVVAGDIVTFEITAVSSAANLQCNLKFTRS